MTVVRYLGNVPIAIKVGSKIYALNKLGALAQEAGRLDVSVPELLTTTSLDKIEPPLRSLIKFVRSDAAVRDEIKRLDPSRRVAMTLSNCDPPPEVRLNKFDTFPTDHVYLGGAGVIGNVLLAVFVIVLKKYWRDRLDD